MARLIVPLLLTAIAVFSIVDIATISRERVKHIPKALWIIFVIIGSVIGSIFWFLFGRARRGEVARPAKRAPLGPDDDPRFFDDVEQRRRSAEQKDRIRDLERQLAELDDDAPSGERPSPDLPGSDLPGGERPSDEPKSGQ